MSGTKKNHLKKRKLTSKIASAAAVGAFMISQDASAQTDAGDLVNLASLDGVTNAVVQPDGSLLVTLSNGQTLTVPAGSFVAENGQFLVPQNVLEDLAGDGPNLALLGLGAAALAAIGVALASGGGDDDDVAVVPAPVAPVAEEEPAGPTPGDDDLTGTDGDDVIDGLAGNDAISSHDGENSNNAADHVDGGSGDDTILADAKDFLTGGDGADVFIIDDDSPDRIENALIQISDFVSGEDRLIFTDELAVLMAALRIDMQI